MANAYPSSPGLSFAIEPFAIERTEASTPAGGRASEKAAVRSLAMLIAISFAMWASVLLLLLG